MKEIAVNMEEFASGIAVLKCYTEKALQCYVGHVC